MHAFNSNKEEIVEGRRKRTTFSAFVKFHWRESCWVKNKFLLLFPQFNGIDTETSWENRWRNYRLFNRKQDMHLHSIITLALPNKRAKTKYHNNNEIKQGWET